MRRFLIRLLFRLLNNRDTYMGIDDDNIEEWLANMPDNPGFREYFRKRDLQLLKTFGIGLDEKAALIWIGQRYELLRLADEAHKALKVVAQRKRKKQNK